MPDPIADQLARLDALAAEHAADRPADAADPAAWHRRAVDRHELELAAVQHLHELRVAAGNRTALAEKRPKLIEQCATCGRHPLGPRTGRGPEGNRCVGCSGRDEHERAALRDARAWPDDQITARADALDDHALATLHSVIGGAAALRNSALRHEVGQAAHRRWAQRQAERAARAKAHTADAQPAQHGHGGPDAAA